MSQNPDPSIPSASGAGSASSGDVPGSSPGGYPPPPPVPGGSHAATPTPSGTGWQPQVRDDERTFAVLAHLSPIVAAVFSVGWLTILGPLLIWAFYRDRSPLVRQAAAGAFNFNLVIWAAIIVGWVCLFTIVLIPVALILWVAAAIVGLVCHIQGAVKASRGEPYRYPFSIPALS